jgi:SAM-dependent methyltransferase
VVSRVFLHSRKSRGTVASVGLPNRLKFFCAGSFLEAVNPRIPGTPHRAAMQLIPTGTKRVLDICAGTGYLARMVATESPTTDVVALDLSPELVTYGERLAAAAGLTNLSFVRGEASHLPFDDASVDLVVSAFGFHELSRAARSNALAEIARVLTRNGAVIIVDVDLPKRWRRVFRAYLRVSHSAAAKDVLGTGLCELLARQRFIVRHHAGQLGTVLPFQILAATLQPSLRAS